MPLSFLSMDLLHTILLLIASGPCLCDPAPANPTPTLGSLASLRGFFFGAAVESTVLFDDAGYREIVKAGEFNIGTPMNDLKMKATEPANNVFDFTKGDEIVQLMVDSNMTVRGHNLVWVAHNPAWLVEEQYMLTDEELNDIMINHIKTVASHYAPYHLYSWDVVNEMVAEAPNSWCTGDLQDSWQCNLKVKTTSDDFVNYTRCSGYTNDDTYIHRALKAARLADPNAKLFLNEYGVHNEVFKFDMLEAMARDLSSEGLLDGIGFQLHVDSSNDGKLLNETALRAVFGRISDLDLEIHITEMTIKPDDAMFESCNSTEEKVAIEGEAYAMALGICLNEFDGCKSFETWYWTDKYMFSGDYDEADVPWGSFWYDTNLQAKDSRQYAADMLFGDAIATL